MSPPPRRAHTSLFQPAPNRELSVVGLPFNPEAESNNDAVSGPGDVQSNTRENTENDLREQLNLPERPRYSSRTK